jgi:hypothetical protein
MSTIQPSRRRWRFEAVTHSTQVPYRLAPQALSSVVAGLFHEAMRSA